MFSRALCINFTKYCTHPGIRRRQTYSVFHKTTRTIPGSMSIRGGIIFAGSAQGTCQHQGFDHVVGHCYGTGLMFTSNFTLFQSVSGESP